MLQVLLRNGSRQRISEFCFSYIIIYRNSIHVYQTMNFVTISTRFLLSFLFFHVMNRVLTMLTVKVSCIEISNLRMC